jgi:hypothetical protein
MSFEPIMLLVILVIPLLLLILLIIVLIEISLKKNGDKCPKCKNTCEKITKVLKDSLMFTMPLRTFIIGFLALCIVAKTSTLLIPEENSIYLVMTLFIILVPITHLIFSCRVKKETLEDEQFRKKWGVLYGSVDLRKGWVAIFCIGVFFSRRILFATMLNDGLMIVQYCSLCYLSLA